MKETLVIMCLVIVGFRQYRELKFDFWISRHLLCKKNKFFRVSGVFNSCIKVKYI